MSGWQRIRRGLRAVGCGLIAAASTPGLASAQRHEDAPSEARVVRQSGPVAVTVYEIRVGGVADHALLHRLARRLHALGFVADLVGEGGRLLLVASEGAPERLAQALKPGLVEVAAVLAEPRVVAGSATPIPGALLVPDAADPNQKWAVSTTERLAFGAPQAKGSQDPYTRQPLVTLALGAQAAGPFGELTGRLVGRQMAVIIDGQVHVAPKVMERIDSGQVQLHLFAGSQPAEAMPALLDGGPLNTPLTLLRTFTGKRADAGGATKVTPDEAGPALTYGTPTRWDPAACTLSGQPTCRIATTILLGPAP